MVYDWLQKGSFSVVWFLITRVKPARIWRVYADGSGLLGIATAFALTLANYTAGTGAIYKVDGEPVGDGLQRAGPRQPLKVEVALGGSVDFDLAWRTLEGGCDRFITRNFKRLNDPDNFTLSSRLKASSYAVDRPGLETVRVDLPPGITPGLWDYRSISEAECRTRTPPPVEFVHFQIEVVDRDGPVMRPLASAKLSQFAIKRGGPLLYRTSWERFEAAPSEIYNTYSRLGQAEGDAPEIVIERRPALNRPVGKYVGVDISAPVPMDVGPGRWRMKQVVISNRPGGRTRVDPLIDLEFEVMD